MNELRVFNNSDFGEIRTLNIDGEPWFVGKDVAEILMYKNTKDAILKHVDEEDKRIIQRSENATLENHIPKSVLPIDFERADIPNRGLTIINESGLYSLILGSKLPTAKKFKRWITSEVLPTLRKVGSYSLAQKPDSYTIDDPIARAKRWIEEKEEYLALENKIKEDKPLVDFANKILSSDSSISMNDMAKLVAKNGIKIGRNRLFRLLRGKGILDSRNVPYQRYIEVQPWFETTEFTYYANGKNNISITTKVTPKGQVGIVKMLKNSSVEG